MNDKKENIQRMLSFSLAVILLLGLVGPTAGMTYDDTEGIEVDEAEFHDDTQINKIEGDITVEENETKAWEDVERVINGNIIVEKDATLKLVNTTLTLTQDEYQHNNITVNSGTLSLDNSTIQTWKEGLDLLRPFLKTDVTVQNGSTLLMQNNSTFSFPGFVNVQESEFNMIDSQFQALDEIPEQDDSDFLWGNGDLSDEAEVDNNDGPRLLVEDSEVYVEGSEINDYYTNDDFPGSDDFEYESEYGTNEMTWYPLDDNDEPIEELQDNEQEMQIDDKNIEEWFLSNPMVSHDELKDYPYINPVDRISSLHVEIEYETEEEYDDEPIISYYSPEKGEYVEAISLPPTNETEETESMNIWEIGLSDFYEGERNEEWRLLHDLEMDIESNEADDLNVTELRLVSSYDNDIHVENSTFTVIDSYIDVDTEKSDIDPRDGEEKGTDKERYYLPNANMDHRTIRLYNGSDFRSYGLEIAPTNESEEDPWILNTEEEHNKTWIYRWVEMQVTTERGRGLEGVRLDPQQPSVIDDDLAETVEEANDLAKPHGHEAWEYMNETGHGRYEEDEERYIFTLKGGDYAGNLLNDFLCEGLNQSFEERNFDIPADSELTREHLFYNDTLGEGLQWGEIEEGDEIVEVFEDESYELQEDTELKQIFLFGLDENYEQYLNESDEEGLNENLIQAFQDRNLPISAEDAELNESEEDNKIWWVEEEGQNIYRIENLTDAGLEIRDADNWSVIENGEVSYRIQNVTGQDDADGNWSVTRENWMIEDNEGDLIYRLTGYENLRVYEKGNFYVTGEDGRITMALASDRLNYPNDFPNAQFVGNYNLSLSYSDKNFAAMIYRSMKDHLENFPTMENPDYLDVEFPMPEPELQIDDITFKYDGEGADEIPENGVGELSVTVKNTGDGAAEDIDVAFYYNRTNDGEEKIRFNLTENWTDLEPEENKTLTVEWPPNEMEIQQGTYDLIAEVDPEEEIIDEPPEDEVVVDVVSNPDIQIEEIHLEGENYRVIEDSEDRKILNEEKVNISAELVNLGEYDLMDANVEIRIINETEEEDKNHTEVIDLMKPGEAPIPVETEKLEWEPKEEGDYTIEVEVKETEITEKVTYEENIEVLSRPRLNLDLQEQEIENNVNVGDEIEITAEVENLGEWPSEQTVIEFLVDDEEEAFKTEDLGPIEEGKETIEITWTAEMSDGFEDLTEEREITAMIDEDDLQIDDGGGNLEDSTSLTVKRRPGLEVFDIEFQENEYFRDGEVMQGKDITLSTIVQNTGDDKIYGAEVEIGIEGEESSIYNEDSIDLEPDQVKRFEDIQWSTDEVESGEYEVNVEISVENGEENIEEGTRDSETKSFEVLSRPELDIESLQFSEGTVRLGEEVDIEANITNDGGWISEEVTVNFFVSDAENEFDDIGTVNLEEGIPGEESAVADITWTSDMLSEYYAEIYESREIRIEMEPDPYQEEENTIILEEELEIERHVDLAFEGEIVYSPESTKGETIEITSTVTNEGDLIVEGFQVDFYIQQTGIDPDEPEKIGEYNFSEEGDLDILDIEDGEEGISSVDITYEWDTSDIEPDEYTVIAEIREEVDIKVGEETETVYDRYTEKNEIEGSPISIMSPPNLELIEEEWQVLEDGEWSFFDPTDQETSINERDRLRFNGTIKNTNETELDLGSAHVTLTYPDGTVNELLGEMPEDEDTDLSQGLWIEDEWTVNPGEDPQSVELDTYIGPNTEEEYIYQTNSWELEINRIQEISITSENFPEEIFAGESYTFEGELQRDDGRPLSNSEIIVILRSEETEVSGTTETDDEGWFSIDMEVPDEEGEYDFVVESQTSERPEIQSDSILNAQTETLEILGMSWWIILVIAIIAAGGVGSTVAYFKFFRFGEMVECGNCGSTISADAMSCPKCGVEFDLDTVKCSECDEWISADSDSCPECGAEFVKTGEEIEDYTDRMRDQYDKFVDRQKRKAEDDLEEELTKEEFMEWWKDQPSYATFDEWLERKEQQRKEGSQECPSCGTLNSVEAAVCQKCGTSLVEISPEQEIEELEEELSEEMSEGLEDISEPEEDEEIDDVDIEEDLFESEDEKEDEKSSSLESTERESMEERSPSEDITSEETETTKKKPKKRKKVKKKVVKKPAQEDEDKDSEEDLDEDIGDTIEEE